MRIGIDLDGVCYDFVGKFREFMEARTGGVYAPVVRWAFYEDWGMTATQFKAWMNEGVLNGGVFREGDPTAGCVDTLCDLLDADHEIIICTNRPDYATSATRDWLIKWDIPYNELIITADKNCHNLDVLLDDTTLVLEQARAAGIRAIAFDQPWNQDWDGERVRSWGEFYETLRLPLCERPDWEPIIDAYTYRTAVAEIVKEFGTLDAEVENIRASTLDEAKHHVCGDRNVQYGDPRQDFTRTAAMWTAYLSGKATLEAHDVAVMMALLKCSRIRWSPEKRDHWVDLAGYAACGAECAPDRNGD